MLDLYLVITPIFGLFSILTLINLKYTLSEPRTKDLTMYEKVVKQQQNQDLVKIQHQNQAVQSRLKKTLSYFLKNFTVAQLCVVRRSRNKVPLLLSFSLIAALSITINTSYTFSFVGTAVTLPFILGKMLTSQKQQTQTEQQHTNGQQQVKREDKDKSQQKLQIIFTSISLITNLVCIWVVYKNYHNVLLVSAAQNLLVTVALDNLVVRPVALVLLSFAVKDAHFVEAFVEKQMQIVEILHHIRVIKRAADVHISALSPKKLNHSPSKVPIAKNIQIQPIVHTDNRQTYFSTIDLTKSLRRPRFSPIGLKIRHQSNQQGESSYISILNSHQKKNSNAVRIDRNSSFQFDKSMFEQRVDQDTIKQQIKQTLQAKDQSNKQQQQSQAYESSNFAFQSCKMNKLQSPKLIMINQDHSIIHNLDNNEIENQEQQDIITNNGSTLKNQKQLGDSDHISRNCVWPKILLHKSIEDEKQKRADFRHFFEEKQEIQQNYQLKQYATLQQDNQMSSGQGGINTGRRNTLLKINQDRKGEDLEQIDLNSPERRKQQLSKKVEDAQKPKKNKKGYKKYSLDPNRHVIKHSTGQPYLEFLPNLLNKQREEKRKRASQQSSQQVFSRKSDLKNGFTNESRLIKSVKGFKNTKEPIVRQNDENTIPEFIIEDFS